MSRFYWVIVFMLFISACSKAPVTNNNNITESLPTINTLSVNYLTSTCASSGGEVTDDGGSSITARGVVWSINPSPTTSLSNKTIDGNGSGRFNSNVNGLTANTTYHLRAYATNSTGTAYGNEISFTTSPYTVYVAGGEDNATGTKRYAMLWKNGQPNVLNEGPGNAVAYSVFVSGNEVFVAGSETNPSSGALAAQAKIWKNGIGTILNGNYANSVFISGNDIYVSGSNFNGTIEEGTIWKNGVSSIVNNGTQNAYPQAIFVSGNDIYAAGYELNINHYQAKLWKNGVASVLGNGTQTASASSVFVSGTDVYVAGYESNGNYNIAKVWKNGIATILGDGTKNSYAKSVYVVGNDVYVAGYESRITNNVAMMWKNGTATALSGNNDAYGNAVFVFNNDVYVAGQDSARAMLWKNGAATLLSNGTNFGSALSVFVK